MSNVTILESGSLPHHPLPAFQSLMALGAMLATLAVVAYAVLSTDVSARQVQLILQGAGVILLVWFAGFLASALHLAALAADTLTMRLEQLCYPEAERA